ncbi:DNA invertase Pin-like site-specific DNA recombinase [Shimia isoporae]|uniref:DNA invertase Pin-like site-specific DNA recombinase n=1 Tax=Shimia isoporae TaxID=647720 RepID=A0A4R1NJB4_9RHOB|nr:recombinase family protein [Shimia isoporae]TCL08254.1 DNA invertase Pin-like site-specific DNA recombinase [Shimia isoporae]
MSLTRKIRCAIYTRKSSEEGLDQDFNSLDAQHEACAACIASQKHEGWKLLPTRYDDGGKSGGTLERPALQQLLADIKAGLIDMVVVYKIDRLTRSLADFARLVDQFEEADCSFVSVTQAFNTSSSMGRLTLNVLLSFAQFEREVTAERIRDKIAASKKKGLWMGGVPPLGYDAHPDPNRRELVVNDAEAETVRRVFDSYDELECLNAVMRQSEAEGLISKRHVFSTGRVQGGRPFSRGQIYHILRNPTYLGRIRHKDKSFPGQHAAIIEQRQWDRVQDKLEAAAMRRRGGAGSERATSATPTAPLLGKLRDETGDILTPSHTQKGRQRHHYYVSNRLISGKPDPTGWRLPAKALEKAVASAIANHLQLAARYHQVLTRANALQSSAASDRVHSLAHDIENGGMKVATAFLKSGAITDGRLQLHLAPDALAKQQGLPGVDLHETLCTIDVPFTIRRRGVEMKIVAGEMQTTPDATLIRALKNAHDWVTQMKAGTSVKHIAAATSISESYITRIIPMAFLSPRIQQAILSGSHPAELTLETIARSKIPMDWSAQEHLFGFA